MVDQIESTLRIRHGHGHNENEGKQMDKIKLSSNDWVRRERANLTQIERLGKCCAAGAED